MVGGTNLAVFVAAAMVLIVTPGPDLIYIVTRGIAQGRPTALAASLGVSTGLLVHTTLAAFGLSVLLSRSLAAFLVVKYAGAAYLVYLGVRTILDRGALVLPVGTPRIRLGRAYRQGVLSNVLNPKAALFMQAFLPQFVVPGAGEPVRQIFLLGLLLIAMGLSFHIAVACGAGQVGAWLRRQPRFTARLRWLTGSIFVGLGLRLAFPERR